MKPGRAEARRMAASVMALRECCVWSQWYSEAFGGREGEESPGLVFAQTKAADDGEGCNDRSVPGFGPFEPKCFGGRAGRCGGYSSPGVTRRLDWSNVLRVRGSGLSVV